MAGIDDYSFGRIVIDGAEHGKDVIILPDRVVGNWWRKDGHGLVLEDLSEVEDELPARLILGTGAEGRMVPSPEVLEALRNRGIAVEMHNTPAAVERYRGLNPAETAAALHLTC